MEHRTSARGWAPALLALLALPLTGCDAISEATSPQVTAQEYLFNFENTINGWVTEGSNVDPDGSDWSIDASQAVAAGGGQSVAFQLDSQREDALIWMEREFMLRSNRSYDLTMTFEFASADWGPGEHWDLVVAAGAGRVDIDDAFHTSSTANGATVADGFRWRSFKLPTELRTGDDGRVRIAIGVGGQSVREGIYYLDELGVKFELLR
ncbi:MAG: hypothetical protein KY453_00820 [Gemmatimonadetes bacterium]|nr:hypothetical protein [Gemmatimonadota bacterium]